MSGGYIAVRELLTAVASSGVVAQGLVSCGSTALGRRFCSFGARDSLLRDMWSVPGSLAGRFLSTGPPGKSWTGILIEGCGGFQEEGVFVKGDTLTGFLN